MATFMCNHAISCCGSCTVILIDQNRSGSDYLGISFSTVIKQMITFSMHSVVSFCSPFTVSQMPQPPMTLDNGFIHRFRFNNVRNKISEVTKANKNSFLKNTLPLNSLYHVTMALFQPFPASAGTQAYK